MQTLSMTEALQTVQHKAADLYDYSCDRLQRAGRASIQHVRAHPIQTTLIVAGVVCLAAALIYRQRSRRNEEMDEEDDRPYYRQRQRARRHNGNPTHLASEPQKTA